MDLTDWLSMLARANWVTESEGGYYTTIFLIIVLVVATVLIVKMDWEKLLPKIMSKVKFIGI